jgi:hypothetical protein
MPNTIEVYVEYVENQLPGLKSGDYTVKVAQTLGATGVPETEFQSRETDFSIRGERFALQPSDIVSVFPPPNSLGEHSGALPQVVFERNTLPWERMIAVPKKATHDDEQKEEQKKVEKMPWLALLVFHEGELTAEHENGIVATLAEFRTQTGRNFPNSQYPNLETADKETDNTILLYAKAGLLKQLLPSGEALAQICHARESSLRLHLQDAPTEDSLYYELWNAAQQLAHAAHVPLVKGKANQQVSLDPGTLKAGTYTVKIMIGEKEIKLSPDNTITITPNDEFGHKVAIVPANRLPKPGARSVVHLVSLEDRYYWDGRQYSFYTGSANDDELIPLASLKTWSFSCVADIRNFDQLLRNLAVKGRGDTLNALRLPLRPNPANNINIQVANRYLQSGYVPLPHYFRRGGNSISWYRGPLMPGNKSKQALPADKFPFSSADSLLLYDEQYGMFDVSYAAAWELGRLIALQNKTASISLYRWKRLHSSRLLLAEQQEQHAHLPFHRDADEAVDMPEDIENWLSALSTLRGLPFNYLVPDERMLPVESIRFFRIDQEWISCLIDGAFSIGRVTSGDAAADQSLHRQQIAGNNKPVASGFLLRSCVVKDWPALQVDGYGKVESTEEGMDANRLKILRMDNLSPNVLLCLFDGDVAAVDIHQKPEALHLGFDVPDPKTPNIYSKKLRNAGGSQSRTTVTLNDQLWDEETRIVDVAKLFDNIRAQTALAFSGKFSSAQFALSMSEGVQKVRLVRGKAPVEQPSPTLRMESGQRLNKGEKKEAAGKGYLTLQHDGNLVFYDAAGQPKWATATNNRQVSHIVMQPDGNLVIYNGTAPVWASDTWNSNAAGGYFEINLITWEINIRRPDGSVARQIAASQIIGMESGRQLNRGEKIALPWKGHLILQHDGNLVYYDSTGQPKWATMTNNKQVTHAVMEPDGNLVIYNETALVWTSDTGNEGAEGGFFEIDPVTFNAYIKRPDGSVARQIPNARNSW